MQAYSPLFESFMQECLHEKHKHASSPLQALIIKVQYALTQSTPLSRATKARLASFSRDLDSPMKVAVIGQFSSGKSTFLNALLGAAILPSGITPVTAKVCELAFGDELALEVHYKNGLVLHRPVGYLAEVDSMENEKIAHYRLLAPLPLLKEVSFIDTPGFNSQNESDTDTTNNLLAKVDGIIWLSLIDNVGKSSEKEVLQKHLQRYANKSLCVLNQKDRLKNDEEIATSLDYARKAFEGFFDEVVAISARGALEGRADSNINAVMDFINDKLRGQATKAKEYRIRRGLREILLLESKRLHRSNQAFRDLERRLGVYVEQVRFQSLQSGLEKRLKKLFGAFDSQLSALAEEIYHSFESKEVVIVRESKSKLGLKKRLEQKKILSALPKERLLSLLGNEDGDFARDLKQLGSSLSDFAAAFKEFIEEQLGDLRNEVLEEWRPAMLKTLQFGRSPDDNSDLALGRMVLDRRFWVETLDCEILRDYEIGLLHCAYLLQEELHCIQKLLSLDFGNALALTLERLNFEVENALSKHRKDPDLLPLYNPTIEAVRNLLNTGLHYGFLQERLSLNFSLYKRALWNLTEELGRLKDKKASLLRGWIAANDEKKIRLRKCLEEVRGF